MELTRITLPPLAAPGEVTTFYAFDGGAARSVALGQVALQLAARANATEAVLMIDWDTLSPGLHHFFDRPAKQPGLLEFFDDCRALLAKLGRGAAAADDEALAAQVLGALDWERYVERVDQGRPLYLMRAGCFDDSYGERADAMDWDSLFLACPALFRCFAAHMAARFAHVLVDAPGGRSAAVSICTTFLPDKLVGLFTPNERSFDGLAGVLRRAISYRCSHEEEQRPLMVYPLPAMLDSADAERRSHWRRGEESRAVPGYQGRLEALLRELYRMGRVSLDSYLDEVQLQQATAIASGQKLAAWSERDADRFSLARTFSTLLHWLAGGHAPWQSHAEVTLLHTIASARAQLQADPADAAAAVPLARALHRLGHLIRGQGRELQALACLEESMQLRQRVLGPAHGDTRASRAALATLLRRQGKLAEARFAGTALLDDCLRLLGPEHPDTLSARAALAATLSMLGEFEAAMALHEQVVGAWERLAGPGDARTLDALAGQARSFARHHELSRALMLYERVLEGRERLLGSEHEDTLRCMGRLARVLAELGNTAHARQLQETVVAARERQAGSDAPATVRAREVLAEILADSGDLDAVRAVQEALARTRVRSLGAEHPETLSIQLRLASTLGQQGELDAARRLQQHVAELHERLHGAGSQQALLSRKMLASTLHQQGHAIAAGKADEAGVRALAAGPHASMGGAQAGAVADAHEVAATAETLEQKLTQLQRLLESKQSEDARVLADQLRKSVLRPSVANPLRRRGVGLIKQVYRLEGDKDALLAITQDEVCWLEGALNEAAGGKPVAAQ